MHKTSCLLLAGACTVLVAGCEQPRTDADSPTGTAAEATVAAHAVVETIADVELSGEFRFIQHGELVHISGSVSGLETGHYGFHIHEGTACDDRGGHYNPTDRPHGAPDEPEHLRHVGDLGNLISRDGHAAYDRFDAIVRLDGEHSVVGRALVIHAERDQFIPQPTGDAGAQIGCGIIELVNGEAEAS